MTRRKKGESSPAGSPRVSPHRSKKLKRRAPNGSDENNQHDQPKQLVPYLPSPVASEPDVTTQTPTTPNSIISEASAQFSILNLSAETTMILKRINDSIEQNGLYHLGDEINDENSAIANEIQRYAKLTNMEKLLNNIQHRKTPPQTPKIKKRFVPFVAGSSPGEAYFLKYHLIKFSGIESKMKVCPYALQKYLKQLTGNEAKTIVSHGVSGFLIEATNTKQADQFMNIKEIFGQECSVENFENYNYSRGLVYLYDYPTDESTTYHQDLMEEFPVIAKVEQASFIKSKNERATPVMLYFRAAFPPPTLDIPGEPYTVKVYHFKNKPFLCRKCLEYGHSWKKCQREQKCKRCCEVGHVEEDCNNSENCLHCSEQHKTGSSNCAKHKEEQAIADIQGSRNVTRQRAKQILSPIPDPPFLAPPFTTRFTMKLDTSGAPSTSAGPRQVSSFTLYRQLRFMLNEKPEQFRKQRNGDYTFRVDSQGASVKALAITKIGEFPCNIIPDLHGEVSKGIIYTSEFHCTDKTSFIEGLKQTERIQDVQEASWIKPRVATSRAFLISFYGNNIPTYLHVLGERAHCKVYPHLPSPMRCKNCQEYGHGTKNCTNEAMCGKCGAHHSTNVCTSETRKCVHCSKDHQVGSKQCSVEMKEREITRTMTTRKIGREAAVAYINRGIGDKRRQEASSGFWVMSPRRETKSNNNLHINQENSDMEGLLEFARNYNSPLGEKEEAIVHFYTQPSQEMDHAPNVCGYFTNPNYELSSQDEHNIHQITQEQISIPNHISNIPLPSCEMLERNSNLHSSN